VAGNGFSEGGMGGDWVRLPHFLPVFRIDVGLGENASQGTDGNLGFLRDDRGIDGYRPFGGRT
jgi:hypothetical protein